MHIIAQLRHTFGAGQTPPHSLLRLGRLGRSIIRHDVNKDDSGTGDAQTEARFRNTRIQIGTEITRKMIMMISHQKRMEINQEIPNSTEVTNMENIFL